MSSVGQGVGALVGGVVGFFTLGGPTGALQGASYGAAIGGALDPADIPGREGPRLSDASEQASGFGVGIPRVYGTIRVAGTVIWIENNRRREVARKTKSSSGKGGGGSQETTTYEYYGTFAVLLADNQVDALKRVWDSRGLLLNTVSDDIGTTIESSGLFPLGSLYNPGNEAALKAALQTTPNAGPKGQIRLYPGFDDQMPDPRMEADLGVGNTPAYRGCTLAVFYDFPLPNEYGQSIIGAQLSFELIANSEEGEATLMDTLWGWIPEDADTTIQCPFLSPDKTRIYCSDGDINNQAVISKAISVGPYGQMPADPLDPAAAVSGVVPTAEGMTYEDIGPVFVGTTERSWYRPSFPVNRATLGADGMDRSDIYTQRDGRWLVTSDDTDNLVFAYTEEDGYSTIGPVSQRIWANTIDEHGNMITVSSGSLKIYDGALTLIKSIDISGQNIDPNTIQPGTKNTLSFRANYDSGIFYMLYMGVEGSIGVHAYNLDLEEELFSTTLSGVTPDPIAESSVLFSAERAVRAVDGFVLVFDIYRRSSDLKKYYVLDYWKLPAPSSNGVLLSTVVRSLIEESELIEAADLDVTDLDQTVRGYKTAGPGSIRQRIEPLMLSHSFDLTMSGYQLKAVKRGAASVMTLDPDDLDARPYGSAPGVALAQSREMDTQLPSVVVVKSLDADRDYEVNQQQSQTMAASRSVNVKEITLPEVFTPDETAGIAEIIWTRSWLERTSFQFSLPQTYRALEATDVVTLPMPDATYSLYLVSVNYTQDNRVECTAVLDDSAIYTTNATGSAGTASSTTIPYDGPSVMHLLDIPAITDTYNDVGFPAALAGYSTTWPGGVIAESNNGGQSYQPIQGYPGAVVSGIVPDALPTADPYVTDTTNTLTVQLYSPSMSISSITKAEMMTGKNWAAYGVAGRWEIIRFADVTVNADDTISLTTMIRGCKGTEQYMSEHDDEDIFVFLSDDDMAFIERASTQIGVSLLYKGVTSGADIDNVSATTFSYTGVNLKPWSAVYPEVTDSGDIVITWKRRSRLESSYWTTGVQIPLGEDTESYEIDILAGSTVLRTLTSTSQTVTYTSAQQTTDSNAADSAIIYQISATVGRGYGTEVAI
jgi:hypothetical protein